MFIGRHYAEVIQIDYRLFFDNLTIMMTEPKAVMNVFRWIDIDGLLDDVSWWVVCMAAGLESSVK